MLLDVFYNDYVSLHIDKTTITILSLTISHTHTYNETEADKKYTFNIWLYSVSRILTETVTCLSLHINDNDLL